MVEAQVSNPTKSPTFEPSRILTMVTTTTDPVVQQLIQAMQVFLHAADKKQLTDTNTWLQNFQHCV